MILVYIFGIAIFCAACVVLVGWRIIVAIEASNSEIYGFDKDTQ